MNSSICFRSNLRLVISCIRSLIAAILTTMPSCSAFFASRYVSAMLLASIDSGCILGLGSVGERMLILLDIEKLMSGVDMGLVQPAEA